MTDFILKKSILLRFCSLLILFSIILGGCSKQEVYYRAGSGSGHKDGLTVLDDLFLFYEQWRGVPYRNGGMSRSGIDCSGLVRQVYVSRFGIVLPRTVDDMADYGTEVEGFRLKAGDLVLFKTGWFDRHVGIYLDEGRFMHVSEKKGVMLSSMSDYYWKDRFWQARRVLN